MSDRPKFSRATALAVAEDLQARLAPACERIAIVGSLRRGAAEMKDAELLFVSRAEMRADDFFGQRAHWLADDVIAGWLKDGLIAKRLNVKGHPCWGESRKHAFHCQSGLPLDLGGVLPEQWCTALVIWTGSKENNIRLATGARRLGRELQVHGYCIRLADGHNVWPASEEEVFELCGVDYLPPEQR